jgi:hypothetical protein
VKIAWATKIGAPDYTEKLLTEVEDRIPAATAWAKANGYTVRVADVDLSTPPDFTRTFATRPRTSSKRKSSLKT